MSDPLHPDEPRYVSEEARDLVQGLGAVSRDLSSLASFMRAAEEIRAQHPDAATQDAHLAAIAEATAELREVHATRRKRANIAVLRSRWVKGAAIGVAIVLATGSLAAAKVLPAPAQNAVAAVAETFGIHLPRDGDEIIEDARNTVDFDGDGIPASEDPDDDRFFNTTISDLDGDGIPAGEDPDDAKVIAKDGLDHDGDGTPDDNGNHGGARPKDGADHDGDGTPDDNGAHVGTDPDKDLGPRDTRPARPKDDAGRPDDPSKPADPGPTGDDAGKPDDPAKSEDAGKPDDPGKSEDADKPDDTGKRPG